MKKSPLLILFAVAAVCCSNPRVEYVDFDTFRVTKVTRSDVLMSDGSMNPEIVMPEGISDMPQTKLASIGSQDLAKNLAGSFTSNSLVHISGTYTGHDLDGSPLTLSGKLLVPENGKIKNLVIVSHYTIGADRDCPSECFPLEGIVAAKGYAVIMPDYIGFGATRDRIHPYLHARSTARSVIDMALAVKPYLKHIGKEPESDEVILFGYSQGGGITMSVMQMIQDEYSEELPIKKAYAGGGCYDLNATYDDAISSGKTGIPCAIPMLILGMNEGEDLDLDMADFFQPRLLENYDEWINSKKYSLGQIDDLMGTGDLNELLTAAAQDKTNPNTAELYKAFFFNSTLHFVPASPVYLFHTRTDDCVPFINALHALQAYKGCDVEYDFGDYGSHSNGAVTFILKVVGML